MTTKTVYKLLTIPFLLHASFLLVVGSVAFYSYVFTGDTIWLAFDWAEDPIPALLLFMLATLATVLPAIPFLADQCDS